MNPESLLTFLSLWAISYSCNEFWTRQKLISCLNTDIYSSIIEILPTKCFRTNDGRSIVLTDGRRILYNCNNSYPDSRVISCLNMTEINDFFLYNCFFFDIKMKNVISDSSFVLNIRMLFDGKELNLDMLTIENLPWLREITVQNPRTPSVFNVALDQLPSLTVFTITNYNFTSFPKKPFRNLRNLQSFHLMNGHLSHLPEDLLYGMDNLKQLLLINNDIEEIPPLLLKNRSLMLNLDISSNRISQLSGELFSDLSNLEILIIKDNKFTTLPENLLVHLPHLTGFDISHNPGLNFLPRGILKDKKYLDSFIAMNCSLMHLDPSLFSDTDRLTSIFLIFNRINHIPPGIFNNTKNLQKLHLETNKITYLFPQTFFHLSKLEGLYLSMNQLQKLSKDIFKYLTALTELSLSNNILQSLNSDTFRSLINLKYLEMSDNKLENLPDKNPFGPSKYLSTIKADNSGLKIFPLINWAEHNLTLVDLSSNFLTEVTLPIFTKNATKIMITNNNISTIYIDYHKYGNSSPIYDIVDINMVCDCKLQQFLHFVQSDRRRAINVFPQIDSFHCSGEEKRKLVTIWPIYTICSVTDDCPSSCQCFLTLERQVVIDCSEQNLRHVPALLPINATFIQLNNNNITHLSEVDVSRWVDITHIWLDNNSLSSLDNWTITPNLSLLSLQGNQLSDLPPLLMDHVASSDSFKIYLANNQWKCDCQSTSFKMWFMQNLDKIADSEKVFCQRTIPINNSITYSLIRNTPLDLFCLNERLISKGNVVVIVSCLLSLTLVFILITIVYSRFKTTILAFLYSRNLYWHCCDRVEECEDKLYDAFLCYNSADRAIMTEMMNRLEPPYRLCIHERDWLVGYPISQHIVSSVLQSRKTVILLSSNFLQSIWFQVEFRVAFNQMMEDQMNRLVLVIVGDLGDVDQLDKDLRHLIATRTYLKWGEKWFWEKLKYFLHR